MASHFNKRIRPTGSLATFLGSNNILTLEAFVKKMWDKLYENKHVINTDGTIAERKFKVR